jgi:hypothetical protein
MTVDGNASRVAHVGSGVLGLKVGDVMRGVSRSIENPHLAGTDSKGLPAIESMQVCRRNRQEIAKQLV